MISTYSTVAGLKYKHIKMHVVVFLNCEFQYLLCRKC